MLTKTYLCAALAVVLSTTSCKKEVVKSNAATSPDFIKVLNFKVTGAGDLSSIENGGYSFSYNAEGNKGYKDLGVCIIDEHGNVVINSKAGGSNDENGGANAKGENGSTYLVGSTLSPELRMDAFKTQVHVGDAYIVKFDKDGHKLWERGYSDTAGGAKGSRPDDFKSVVYRNGKVYCFGGTENYNNDYSPQFPSATNWLVVFDENGTRLEDKLLPSLTIGKFPAVRFLNVLELSNGDVLLHQSLTTFAARPQDTSAFLARYSIELDSVLWVKYYETASPSGDPVTIGQTENGDIIALNTFNTELIRYSSVDGHFISTQSTNFETGQSGLQYIVGTTKIFRIGGVNYIVGAVDEGLSWTYAAQGAWSRSTDSRPWIMKFADNGEIEYSKIFDVPNSNFTSVTSDASGNLKMFGTLTYFNQYHNAPFLMTIDPAGNIVVPK